MVLQPITFGVSFNLNLQSQYRWSLCNGTWQKTPEGLDPRLRFEGKKFSVESSLQLISSNFWLWKRNDSSVVL